MFFILKGTLLTSIVWPQKLIKSHSLILVSPVVQHQLADRQSVCGVQQLKACCQLSKSSQTGTSDVRAQPPLQYIVFMFNSNLPRGITLYQSLISSPFALFVMLWFQTAALSFSLPGSSSCAISTRNMGVCPGAFCFVFFPLKFVASNLQFPILLLSNRSSQARANHL